MTINNAMLRCNETGQVPTTTIDSSTFLHTSISYLLQLIHWYDLEKHNLNVRSAATPEINQGISVGSLISVDEPKKPRRNPATPKVHAGEPQIDPLIL